MDPEELLKRQSLAIELAHQAGKIICETSGNIKTIDTKCGFADLVTESDKAVEKLIFDEIKKQYPNDRFIGEESASDVQLTNDPTWIIDPIDGTTNFVHTFPQSCVSIGFAFGGEPCMGVIYNPHFDHLYTAIKGKGAKLTRANGQETVPLRVRPCQSLREALILTESGSDRAEGKKECFFQNMMAIGWKSHGVRMLGSCALNICAVAAGQADAFFEFGPHIWDFCAGVVILTEAGGFCCDTKGGPFDLKSRRIIAACSESLAKEIAENLVIHYEYPKD